MSPSRNRNFRPSLADAERFIIEFLSVQLPERRRIYVRRFKRFARFRGLPEPGWKCAVGRLLGSQPSEAIQTLSRYARWLRREGLVGRDNEYGGGGFAAFSKAAHLSGLIAWRYRGALRSPDQAGCPLLDRRLEERLRSWREHLANSNYRPTTIEQKVAALRMLGRFLGARRVDYRQVTPELLETWKMRGLRPLAPRTAGNRLRAVSAFYQWLVQAGSLGKNPAADLGRPKLGPRAAIPVLTQREVRDLLRAARSPRDQAMFELFYATGSRLGEIIGLDLEDLSLRMRRLQCTGKGRKERLVFFGRAALRAIRLYLPWREAVLEAHRKKGEPALFISNQGTRIHESTVERALRVIARRSSVRKRIYPHLLRHSFATHLANRGAATRAVQELLGHAHPTTTARYTRLGLRRLRHAYDAAHPWSR